MPPPRVLVIAEAANPDWVSVPLVGWSLAHALREVADVHLVTQIRNRDAILRQGYAEGTEFTCIDSEAVAARLNRLSHRLRRGDGAWALNTALMSFAHRAFERLLWARFGDDLRRGRYDLVHRVTPVSPSVASPIAPRIARAGVPFVLGPINGGLPWPPTFRAAMRSEREGLSRLRSIARLAPGWSATYRASAAILAGTRHVAAQVPQAARSRVIHLAENAVDRARFDSLHAERRLSPLPEAPGTPPLRACFIGRVVPVKGLDMALEAAAPLLADGRMTFDILGDGESRAGLQALAERLGVAGAVRFHGWVPHEGIAERVAQANVLLFPSVKDFGGGAVLEGMALGLVPVVLDYGGPPELVGPQAGLRVPLGTRPETAAALRRALEGLAAAPDRLPPMARAAVERVDRLYTWPAKARQVAEVYDWVRGLRPDRPTFPTG